MLQLTFQKITVKYVTKNAILIIFKYAVQCHSFLNMPFKAAKMSAEFLNYNSVSLISWDHIQLKKVE